MAKRAGGHCAQRAALARQVVSPRLSALRDAHLKRVRSVLMANGFFCFTCTDTLLFHIRYYYTACSGDASCPTPFFLPSLISRSTDTCVRRTPCPVTHSFLFISLFNLLTSDYE